MPNWETEVNKLKYQQKVDHNFEIKERKLEVSERERLAQHEIKNKYEKIILPGFEILDTFNIKESLTDIRDQIWKTGEVIKRPNNFQEYQNRSESIVNKRGINREREAYNREYDSNSGNLPLLSLKKINDIVYTSNYKESKLAKYVLLCPDVLKYVPSTSYDAPEHVEKVSESLVVATNGEKIFIYSGSDTNIDRAKINYQEDIVKSISIKEKSKTEINDWISETLLKDCLKRRDYTKVDQELLSHPKVYNRYLRKEQLPENKQTLSVRNFLDILLK